MIALTHMHMIQILLASLLLVSFGARADVIMYSDDFDLSFGDKHSPMTTKLKKNSVAYLNFGGTDSVSLPEFDPALGTLTGVEYWVEGVYGWGAKARVYRVRVPGNVVPGSKTYLAVGGEDDDGEDDDAYLLGPITVTDGIGAPVYIDSRGRYLLVSESVPFEFHPPIITDPETLARVTGTGTSVDDVQMMSDEEGSLFFVNTDGRLKGRVRAWGNVVGTLKVAYHYEAARIPEPTSIALMAFGLIAIGVLGWRRGR